MKKIPIKIAVVAGSNGDWFAQGDSRDEKLITSFETCFECISEEGYQTGRRYFVEAEVEVPDEELTFQGNVKSAEPAEPAF